MLPPLRRFFGQQAHLGGAGRVQTTFGELCAAPQIESPDSGFDSCDPGR
jgi:hypothetical protein